MDEASSGSSRGTVYVSNRRMKSPEGLLSVANRATRRLTDGRASELFERRHLLRNKS